MNEGLNEAWKRAIDNKDVESIQRLAWEERHKFSDFPLVTLRLSFRSYDIFYEAIKHHVPLERFIFLINHTKLMPGPMLLSEAVVRQNWQVAHFLHDRGIRHKNFDQYFQHLEHIFYTEGEENGIAFILCYPMMWNVYPEKSKYQMLVDAAKHRRAQACKASVALLSLRKKRPNLASKDVLRLIAQMMMDKRSVAREAWGSPFLTSYVRREMKKMSKGFVMYCLFIFGLMLLYKVFSK